MSARKLYINTAADSPTAAMVNSQDNLAAATLPDLVLHDTRDLELYFVDGAGGFTDLSGHTIKAAIGFPGEAPTGGTFNLKMGIGSLPSGTDVDFDATAAEIQTALGGSSVALVTGSSPQWTIKWQANGAISSDNSADNLTPDARVDVVDVVTGDSSTQAEQILILSRAEVVTQNTWSAITNGWSAALSLNTDKLVRLLAGSASASATFEVEVTDGSGNRTTVLQVPVTLRAEVIKDATVVPQGTEEYYTKAQADGLFLKISQNLADGTAATMRINLGVSAANTPYTPAVSGDWTTAPDDVKEALDELADRTQGVDGLKTEGGSSSVSAAGTDINIDPTDTKSSYTYLIDAAAGSGAYTQDYILQRPSSGEVAQVVFIRINLAKSGNPTVRILDEATTDSASDDILLFSATGSTKRATEYFVLCGWNDTDSKWELLFESSGSAAGYQTIWVPAVAMVSATTNGAAATTAESSTYAVMTQGFAFDAATQEYAQFTVALPEAWDAGTVLARCHWYSASTGDVVWSLQGVCLDDNAAIDQQFGSAVSVTDTATTASRTNVTDTTGEVTLSNAAAPAMTVFRVSRDAANSADTLSADAVLLGVEVLYLATVGNDD